jgi:hypothetical protein
LRILDVGRRIEIVGGSPNYSFPTVPAGTYNVTATKEGFQQEVRPGVELHVSDVMWNGISALLSFVQLHVG